MNITGRTRVFVLLGDPVSHSVSPVMQNAAFRVLGLDAVYLALPCAEAALPTVLHAVADAGGGGNVTIPHKAAAARAVDRTLGPLPGVCNTFWGDEGALVGTNTDLMGVEWALDRLEAPATSWLILGTGASSRAVLAVAQARGARVAIRSRDPARAAALLRDAGPAGGGVPEEACEVVINTTPLGLRPDDPLPVTPFETPGARWVLDLVYATGGTTLVRCYAERGVRAMDGREMLVGQGAAAFERWFPGVRAPVEIMRAAVRASLG